MYFQHVLIIKLAKELFNNWINKSKEIEEKEKIVSHDKET